MPPVSLQVSIFKNWILENPFWIASAHFSDSEVSVAHWKPLLPSAITLKTVAENLRAKTHPPGYQIKVHVDPCRAFAHPGHPNPANLYCDGEPRDEYLTIKRAQSLLHFAKRELSDRTKVGISIMMGEDYSYAANQFSAADFAELNLKYAARLDNSDDSYFDVQQKKFKDILDDVGRFCDAFGHVPLFIKLTRELPWLLPSNEFKRFLDLLLTRGASHRIGLIIANTRKVKVPANLVPEVSKKQHKGEMDGGILAGSHLYIETYNLIRTLKEAYYPGLGETIPIIATGGVITLASFIEMIYAGAIAVQLCTAFATYGLKYYDRLRQDLESLVIATRGCTSYEVFHRKVQPGAGEGYASLDLRNLLIPMVFSVQALIFGLAWWTVFKVKPSARRWGISASLVYVLISVWSIIYFSRPIWGTFGVMLTIGIAGVVIFLWRDKQPDSKKSPSISGDCESNHSSEAGSQSGT